jgi:hypothetical protein
MNKQLEFPFVFAENGDFIGERIIADTIEASKIQARFTDHCILDEREGKSYAYWLDSQKTYVREGHDYFEILPDGTRVLAEREVKDCQLAPGTVTLDSLGIVKDK